MLCAGLNLSRKRLDVHLLEESGATKEEAAASGFRPGRSTHQATAILCPIESPTRCSFPYQSGRGRGRLLWRTFRDEATNRFGGHLA
jgi:hypothetical protein